MIRLRVYTDERHEGGWYLMQPWWRNIITTTPVANIDEIRIAVAEWGATIPDCFTFWSDVSCFLEFENEADATMFLLRWS